MYEIVFRALGEVPPVFIACFTGRVPASALRKANYNPALIARCLKEGKMDFDTYYPEGESLTVNLVLRGVGELPKARVAAELRKIAEQVENGTDNGDWTDLHTYLIGGDFSSDGGE